ncbi:ATP-binding protein [Streptosporangium sp. NPDC020145]|uniref:HAMP domain-containing sensor histidine kinase n=1 Tax=Streptosporangium sp. NPDC020145 TaxID=3154694 RepID=UPI0034214E07
MSLRWKISAAVAVVSVLVAVALSLSVHLAYARRQADDAHRLQAERIRLLLREYHRGGQTVFGSRLDDPAVPADLRAAARDGAVATALRRTREGTFVWAAAGTGGHVLSLRSDYGPSLADLAALDRVLVLGSAGAGVGGTLAGITVGARLSRRLRRAAAAARHVSAGDPTVRVGAEIGGRSHDEAAELAHAVDAMAEALQGRLEAERRVTADIAHELRTPLTGLTTAAELLPPGRMTDIVQDRVKALRALTEDVLEVARLDTATERPALSDVALGDFVTRRATAFVPDAQVRVRTGTVVATDPRRLERILANLLTNATRHGRPPIAVVVDGLRVTVHDHGPGFPDHLLRAGPMRFRKGGDPAAAGHGLGLTIAAGQAAVLGARLTFTNPPEGGALATLDLPVASDVP